MTADHDYRSGLFNGIGLPNPVTHASAVIHVCWWLLRANTRFAATVVLGAWCLAGYLVAFFGRTRGSPLPWCLVPRWVFGGFFGGEHEVRRYRGAWCLVPRWVFGGFFGGEHEVRRYRDSRFLVLGSSYSES